jgi:hypothetical protein
MSKCNTYCVLWLCANFAQKNTLDQAVGVLRIAKRNSTIEQTKRLDIKVNVSGLKITPKSYFNTIVNMPLKDENKCESGGRNKDKTLFFKLKIKLVARLEKLLKFQKDSSVKNVMSPLLLKDTTRTTVNHSTLSLFVDNVTSILAKASSLLSSPSAWSNSHGAIYENGAFQHLMIEDGEYKL